MHKTRDGSIVFGSGLGDILSALAVMLIACAVAVFVWGMVMFIAKAGDEKARTEGKQQNGVGYRFAFCYCEYLGVGGTYTKHYGIYTLSSCCTTKHVCNSYDIRTRLCTCRSLTQPCVAFAQQFNTTVSAKYDIGRY